MKPLVLTMATPNIIPYCTEIVDTQRTYAEKHGFDFHSSQKIYWEDLHPSFSKVWEIREALRKGHEFVMWADADVAIMDSNYDFFGLLNPDYHMAAYRQMNWKDWAYLCAGFIVFRNNPDALEFLDKWVRKIETRSMVDHPWEQWYMDELLREWNWKGIRCCTAEEIGCFSPEIWHDTVIWKQGMPSVHFAGPASWEERQKLFNKFYKPLVV